jgi:hypothetical protein
MMKKLMKIIILLKMKINKRMRKQVTKYRIKKNLIKKNKRKKNQRMRNNRSKIN